MNAWLKRCDLNRDPERYQEDIPEFSSLGSGLIVADRRLVRYAGDTSFIGK